MVEKQAEKIIEILNKEHGYYKDLLELSNKKKAVVVEGKVSDLDKIIKVEQNMIFDLGQLEKLREKELHKLCEMLELNGKATVSELSEFLPENLAAQLRTLQQGLTETISGLKNANDLNGQLIQQSLEYIEYSVNMITSAGPVNSLYDDLKGANRGTNNKKRLFDTKI